MPPVSWPIASGLLDCSSSDIIQFSLMVTHGKSQPVLGVAGSSGSSKRIFNHRCTQMNANNSAPGKRGLPALKHCVWDYLRPSACIRG